MLDSINLYKKIEKSNMNVCLCALNFDHWIQHEYYIDVVLNSQRTKINSTANVSTLYLFAFRIIITSCKITFRLFFHIFAHCFFIAWIKSIHIYTTDTKLSKYPHIISNSLSLNACIWYSIFG